jgi:hypothetical protein
MVESGQGASQGPGGYESSGADEAVSVLIPYKNPKALIGYYLGVFSIIPVVGLLLGPAAIVLGILGLRARSRNPQMHGLGHGIVALVCGTIGTLENWGFVALTVIAALSH